MLRRLALFAPFLALGPLTGPLAALATHYVRRRRWGMAAVCALGMAELILGLPSLLVLELQFIDHVLHR